MVKLPEYDNDVVELAYALSVETILVVTVMFLRAEFLKFSVIVKGFEYSW